jgi:mRNA interferase MazF
MTFGDVVLVSFPFTNQIGRKQRPAVVVSSDAYQQAKPDVILMAVTSQVPAVPRFGEVVLADWRCAGLLKPSVLKPVVFTVERPLIVKSLGQLQPPDERALRESLAAILG